MSRMYRSPGENQQFSPTFWYSHRRVTLFQRNPMLQLTGPWHPTSPGVQTPPSPPPAPPPWSLHRASHGCSSHHSVMMLLSGSVTQPVSIRVAIHVKRILVMVCPWFGL